MTTTSHTNCLHTQDKAGRARCRKAGGPEFYARKVQRDMIASGEALCAACFWYATDSALENWQGARLEQGLSTDIDEFALATAYSWAREYLFDRSSLSACEDHRDRI